MSIAYPDRLSATIDLDAVIHNWRILEAIGTTAMPVVKADGYGHGKLPVAKALHHAGCNAVFTASLAEAVEIKEALPDLAVAYFDGLQKGDIEAVLHYAIIPVLNTPQEYEYLLKAAKRTGQRLPAMLHVDTGMSRLGFTESEATTLMAHDDLGMLDWQMVMSHLAVADTPEDDMNSAQKAAFDRILKRRPPALQSAKASLAATAGIMLGADYHYDVTRPGIGLYGLAPNPNFARDKTAKLKPSITLKGRVLQIKDAGAGQTVGYGKTHKLSRQCRLATIGGGYADGITRQLSNTGAWGPDGRKAPIVGSVSMDVHVIDITDWPQDSLKVGDMISLIETADDIHEIAKKTGVIAHDLLTRLGVRAKRHYVGNIVKEIDIIVR